MYDFQRNVSCLHIFMQREHNNSMNIRINIWPDLKWGIELKLFVQRYDSILFSENCVFSSLFRLFQENKTRMKKTQRGFLHIVHTHCVCQFFAVCSFFMNISTWFLCCDTFCFVLIITSIIIVQRSSAACQTNKQHRQSTTE